MKQRIKYIPWKIPIFIKEKVKILNLSNKIFNTTILCHISELDEDTLSAQCDMFRQKIFKVAKKKDPRKK
jgi:hypothetical protein